MAQNNNPPPVVTDPNIIISDFQAKWLDKFKDNVYEDINAGTFRELITDLPQTFANWLELSTNRVRGATYTVRYTDQLSQVPPAYLILGMQLVATYGVDTTTASAGITAAPIYYQLIADSTSALSALADAAPATTERVPARWVRVSGTDEQKLASFEELILEDQPYKAGDVRRYTFPSGETRLVQWKADSTDYQHPLPTGLDTDPIYRSFALLSATSAGASQAYVDEGDAALRARLDSQELRTEYVNGNTVMLDRPGQYPTKMAGDVQLNLTGAKVGTVAIFTTGPNVPELNLSGPQFQRSGSGKYKPMATNQYGLTVKQEGVIGYKVEQVTIQS